MTIKAALAMRAVLSKIQDKPIKARTSYTIMKILKETEDTERFYIDKVNGLLEKYAEKENDGKYKISNGSYVFSAENGKEFDKSINELHSLEVDGTTRRISLSELDGLDLSPRDMGDIECLITED